MTANANKEPNMSQSATIEFRAALLVVEQQITLAKVTRAWKRLAK